MLKSPTIEKLKELKLTGMTKALEEQLSSKSYQKLSFDERMGHLVDYEKTVRENKRLEGRLRRAKLKQQACIEDIDFKHQRGLDRSMIMSLTKCTWIKDHYNILLTGLTGVGKSYIACALAHNACLRGFTSVYIRAPRMFSEIATARADGRYPKLMNSYAKADVLIIDDWGLSKLAGQDMRDFLEIMEDRYELKSTIITSQVPIDKWHELINDSTVADAILDRLVHNSYRVELKGESMRKTKKNTKAERKKDD